MPRVRGGALRGSVPDAALRLDPLGYAGRAFVAFWALSVGASLAAFTICQTVDLASAPSALWAPLTDTARLNRAVGLSKIQLTPCEGDQAARYSVKTVLDGFPVRYLEFPFEWEEHRWFEVRRVMDGGVTRSLVMRMDFEGGEGGGTRVRFSLTLEPRFALLRPVMAFVAGRRLATFCAVASAVDVQLQQSGSGALSPHQGVRDVSVDSAALDRAGADLRARLPEALHPLGQRLIDHVARAWSADLIRLRPFELADEWGEERRALLRVCLLSVQAGLLEVSWELVCPSCGTGSAQLPSLADVSTDGHCHLCDIGFGLSLDQAVEATFHPAAGVRPVPFGPFCPGGPARTPHVAVQRIVLRGAAVGLDAPESGGRHRLFVRGGATVAVLVGDDAPSDVTVEIDADGGLRGDVRVAPSGRIQVRNGSSVDRHVKLERHVYAEQAATAQHLAALPDFRRDFSAEVLAPGVSLRVTRTSILFSDLTASTRLYAVVGDAPAFRLVQDHFTLLSAIIDANDGAIVKTIGDAVMAVFPDDAAAVRAAADMLAAWPEFQKDRAHASGVYLKLGVHAGPCFAVTANRVLDYFGQTVNLAARLQGAAAPDELVVAADVLAGVWTAALGERLIQTERFDAVLKGVQAPVSAVRLGLRPR